MKVRALISSGIQTMKTFDSGSSRYHESRLIFTQHGLLIMEQNLLANLLIHGLQESEIGLTKRLINRIRVDSERSFVNGNFLIPTAIRYDMLDDSRYNKDRCSIFLGFPYFAVKKQEEEKLGAFSKGARQHPARTLLQSRYRLNKTTKRDESQCITELSGDKLKSCIEAPPDATEHLTRKKVEELIYVPQLWTLIIGLG